MVVSPVSLLRMQRQRARVIVASSPISGIEGDKCKRIYTWQSGSLLDSGCHRTLKPWSLLVASHVDPLLACSDPILLDLISKGIYRSRDHWTLTRLIDNESPPYNKIHVALDPSRTVLLFYLFKRNSCAWLADFCQWKYYPLANKEHASLVWYASDVYRKEIKCWCPNKAALSWSRYRVQSSRSIEIFDPGWIEFEQVKLYGETCVSTCDVHSGLYRHQNDLLIGNFTLQLGHVWPFDYSFIMVGDLWRLTDNTTLPLFLEIPEVMPGHNSMQHNLISWCNYKIAHVSTNHYSFSQPTHHHDHSPFWKDASDWPLRLPCAPTIPAKMRLKWGAHHWSWTQVNIFLSFP